MQTKTRERRNRIPAVLFVAALGCFLFAIGDVHASPVRAAIAVVAGAALWIVGEARSR